MKKGKSKKMKNTEACCSSTKGPCGGCAYGLGVIGAAVYYISVATGFWVGVVGVLKALVWPAFVVFELLKFLAA